MDKGYNVVFREKSGFLTWSSYESETQYKEIGHFRGEPVEVGVSVERARQLCQGPLEEKAKELGLN